MRIGPSLLLASRQTLAMTPQLQQAIKLLQFSHLELAAYIQQELEKNPLLSESAPEDGTIEQTCVNLSDSSIDSAFRRSCDCFLRHAGALAGPWRACGTAVGTRQPPFGGRRL